MRANSRNRAGQSQRAAPTGSPAGFWAVAPGWSGAEPWSPDMALSDTARRFLT